MLWINLAKPALSAVFSFHIFAAFWKGHIHDSMEEIYEYAQILYFYLQKKRENNPTEKYIDSYAGT